MEVLQHPTGDSRGPSSVECITYLEIIYFRSARSSRNLFRERSPNVRHVPRVYCEQVIQFSATPNIPTYQCHSANSRYSNINSNEPRNKPTLSFLFITELPRNARRSIPIAFGFSARSRAKVVYGRIKIQRTVSFTGTAVRASMCHPEHAYFLTRTHSCARRQCAYARYNVCARLHVSEPACS